MPPLPLALIILCLTLILSGCATLESWQSSPEVPLDSTNSWLNHRLKAPPAVGTGFVPMEQLAKDPDLPFDKAWIKEGVDWKRYGTIYIAPVNTDYLRQSIRWREAARTDPMQQEVKNLETFIRAEFIKAFQMDPQQRWCVAMSPEKGSLTLLLAITELIPSRIVLNALKIVAPFGSGLALTVLERGTDAQSMVAFEARVNDSDTLQTLAMFADREYATVRPIDFKGLSRYGNVEDIITQWAKQFVDIVNRQPGQIIRPASTFSLMPW